MATGNRARRGHSGMAAPAYRREFEDDEPANEGGLRCLLRPGYNHPAFGLTDILNRV